MGRRVTRMGKDKENKRSSDRGMEWVFCLFSDLTFKRVYDMNLLRWSEGKKDGESPSLQG